MPNSYLPHIISMKHGRGTKGAAPTSDAAGRGDAPGTPLPRVRLRHVTWIPRVFSRLAPTRANAAPTRADLRGIGPTRAWIGLNQPYQPKRLIQAEIQKKKKYCS